MTIKEMTAKIQKLNAKRNAEVSLRQKGFEFAGKLADKNKISTKFVKSFLKDQVIVDTINKGKALASVDAFKMGIFADECSPLAFLKRGDQIMAILAEPEKRRPANDNPQVTLTTYVGEIKFFSVLGSHFVDEKTETNVVYRVDRPDKLSIDSKEKITKMKFLSLITNNEHETVSTDRVKRFIQGASRSVEPPETIVDNSCQRQMVCLGDWVTVEQDGELNCGFAIKFRRNVSQRVGRVQKRLKVYAENFVPVNENSNVEICLQPNYKINIIDSSLVAEESKYFASQSYRSTFDPKLVDFTELSFDDKLKKFL